MAEDPSASLAAPGPQAAKDDSGDAAVPSGWPDIAREADHAPPGTVRVAPAQHASKVGPRGVGLLALFSTFLLIGAISFGGGVVAYLREHLVRKHGWLTDEEFLAVLEISQTLPGLNSTNSAVLVGDRLCGPLGAVVATLGMLLPGTILIFIFSLGFNTLSHNPATKAILQGVAAAATGLMLGLTLQVGKKQFTYLRDCLVVVATVVMASYYHLSLLTILFTIGPVAIWLYRPRATPAPAEEERQG